MIMYSFGRYLPRGLKLFTIMVEPGHPRKATDPTAPKPPGAE
jgi:hypothetical protein